MKNKFPWPLNVAVTYLSKASYWLDVMTRSFTITFFFVFDCRFLICFCCLGSIRSENYFDKWAKLAFKDFTVSLVHEHLLNYVLVVDAGSYFFALWDYFGHRSIACEGRINNFFYILAVLCFIETAREDRFGFTDILWLPEPCWIYFLRQWPETSTCLATHERLNFDIWYTINLAESVWGDGTCSSIRTESPCVFGWLVDS